MSDYHGRLRPNKIVLTSEATRGVMPYVRCAYWEPSRNLYRRLGFKEYHQWSYWCESLWTIHALFQCALWILCVQVCSLDIPSHITQEPLSAASPIKLGAVLIWIEFSLLWSCQTPGRYSWYALGTREFYWMMLFLSTFSEMEELLWC